MKIIDYICCYKMKNKDNRTSITKYNGIKIGDVVYIPDVEEDGVMHLAQVTDISKYSMYAEPQYAGRVVIHHKVLGDNIFTVHSGTWSEDVVKLPRKMRNIIKN